MSLIIKVQNYHNNYRTEYYRVEGYSLADMYPYVKPSRSKYYDGDAECNVDELAYHGTLIDD